jgi:hypothetical protein
MAALMQSIYVAALVFVQVVTLSYFLLDRMKEPNILVVVCIKIAAIINK